MDCNTCYECKHFVGTGKYCPKLGAVTYNPQFGCIRNFKPKKENKKMEYEFVDLSLRLIDVTQMDYCDEKYIKAYHNFDGGTNLFKPLREYSEGQQQGIIDWICNDMIVFEWCLEKNIIREKKEEVFYAAGNYFKNTSQYNYDDTFIIARVADDDKDADIINLISIRDGNIWSNSIRAKNKDKITQQEFDHLTNYKSNLFTKVEIEIKIKT